MRRKLNTLISVFVILLFIAIFNALYATNVPEAPDNVVYTIKNTASLNVVSFQVKTDKPSYSRGETIQIQFYISIKNVGEKNITMGSYTLGCEFYDSNKRGLFGIGSSVTLVSRTILPQAEFEIRDILRWNTGNMVPGIHMVPGIYTIKVMFSAFVEATAEVEVEIKK